MHTKIDTTIIQKKNKQTNFLHIFSKHIKDKVILIYMYRVYINLHRRPKKYVSNEKKEKERDTHKELVQ